MKEENLTAKQMFKLCYGGNKNLMSDKILSYGKINKYLAYEISKGSGFNNNSVYAVSFVRLNAERELKGDSNLFKTFESLKEAESYIKQLKTTEEEIKFKDEEGIKEDIKKPIREELKTLISKSNNKVYCILKNVSSNGMSRRISFFIVVDNEPLNINTYITKLLSYSGSAEYIKISGCGMDMGFSVVSNLSTNLYNDYKVLRSEWF